MVATEQRPLSPSGEDLIEVFGWPRNGSQAARTGRMFHGRIIGLEATVGVKQLYYLDAAECGQAFTKASTCHYSPKEVKLIGLVICCSDMHAYSFGVLRSTWRYSFRCLDLAVRSADLILECLPRMTLTRIHATPLRCAWKNVDFEHLSFQGIVTSKLCLGTDRGYLQQEAEFLKRCQSANVVQYLGFTSEMYAGGPPSLAVEWMSASLKDVMDIGNGMVRHLTSDYWCYAKQFAASTCQLHTATVPAGAAAPQHCSWYVAGTWIN